MTFKEHRHVHHCVLAIDGSWDVGACLFDDSWDGGTSLFNIELIYTHFTWNALLVPLWSRSWQKHAISNANCSNLLSLLAILPSWFEEHE